MTENSKSVPRSCAMPLKMNLGEASTYPPSQSDAYDRFAFFGFGFRPVWYHKQ